MDDSEPVSLLTRSLVKILEGRVDPLWVEVAGDNSGVDSDPLQRKNKTHTITPTAKFQTKALSLWLTNQIDQK